MDSGYFSLFVCGSYRFKRKTQDIRIAMFVSVAIWWILPLTSGNVEISNVREIERDRRRSRSVEKGGRTKGGQCKERVLKGDFSGEAMVQRSRWFREEIQIIKRNAEKG